MRWRNCASAEFGLNALPQVLPPALFLRSGAGAFFSIEVKPATPFYNSGPEMFECSHVVKLLGAMPAPLNHSPQVMLHQNGGERHFRVKKDARSRYRFEA
jgi:hypothetical protein